MNILHYKQDWRSVAFTLLCISLLLIPFGIKIQPAYAPLWILFSSLFCFNACIINHNHVHREIFVNKTLNKLFAILLTLAKGHTSSGVILAHNFNHHLYNGNNNDWIRPQLSGHGPGLIRLFRFIVHSIIEMNKGKREYDKTSLPESIEKNTNTQRLALFIFIALLVTIDATIFILYVAIPWLIGIISLIGVNLLQHDQCDPESDYNQARNFTSDLSNWFFFNNGYHTAHHLRPDLHWSQLRSYHLNEVQPYINKNLLKKSILFYLIKNYLLAK